MATITFLLQSKTAPANIYVRLSIDRKNVFKRKTGYLINPADWSNETNLPKQTSIENKNLRSELKNLSSEIENRLNIATSSGEEISGGWLQLKIDEIQGRIKTTDKDRLINCIDAYINYLPRKQITKKKKGATEGTVKKYQVLKSKMLQYESYLGKKIQVKDVGRKFAEKLEEYWLNEDRLSKNTTGRYLVHLKTVCLWGGKDLELQTHSTLKEIQGYSDEAAKVFLSFDELETIANTSFTRPALENARDWLIIGCYTGQRVSDLLSLTSKNIRSVNGIEIIELRQKKTRKDVVIPMHPIIKNTLEKYKGEFPYKISDQRFNEYLKDVCKLAGIDQPTEGMSKIDIDEDNNAIPKNKHRWRKRQGIFPKCELVSSHVCRRSYATNFYGEMPTSWLLSITGHSTEKQFLEYVGKPEIDTAKQIANFYTQQILQARKEPQMTVLRNAK